MNRELTRKFLRAVNWATARNIDILIHGKDTKSQSLRVELDDMTQIINPSLRLKKLRNSIGRAVYAMGDYPRHYVSEGNHFTHDCLLRDCLAKFFWSIEHEEMDALHLRKPADATAGEVYFEMDNGHMGPKQLADKIRTYYSGDGPCRVIFFMADREGKAHLEKRRLDLLFEIVKDTLPRKKGRVLGACYTQFIEDGKLYNWRG